MPIGPIGSPEDVRLLEKRFAECCAKWLYHPYASTSNLKTMIARMIETEIYRGNLGSIFDPRDRGILADGLISSCPANLSVDLSERKDEFTDRVYARIRWGVRETRAIELGFAYSDQYSQRPPTLSEVLGIKPRAQVADRPYPACPKCREKELPSATASWCERCSSMMYALSPHGPGSNLGKAIGSAVREHQERIKESIGYLRYLMTLGAAVLWEQADDSTKRFSMIELSDKPEPVKQPPKEWVRPALSTLSRPSEVDKWGGVGELLIELS